MRISLFNHNLVLRKCYIDLVRIKDDTKVFDGWKVGYSLYYYYGKENLIPSGSSIHNKDKLAKFWRK